MNKLNMKSLHKIKGLVNINGNIFPIQKAMVFVFDHGFLYGDSVYETFRTYGGYPFQLTGHLNRLFQSAKEIALVFPFTKQHIRSEIFKTMTAYWKRFHGGDSSTSSQNDKRDDLYIRVIISRGYGDIGFNPKLCKSPPLIIIIKKNIPTEIYYYKTGVNLAIVPVIRNNPKSLDPNIKSGNYLNNILAYQKALQKKAYDAVMLNHEGHVTELTTSNIFIVKNKIIYTPSLQCGLLKGLTRTLILDIAQKKHLKLKETHITKEQLLRADECFLTSSLKRILPVTRCNHRKIGSGKVGPVTQKLVCLFEEAISECLKKEYGIEFQSLLFS